MLLRATFSYLLVEKGRFLRGNKEENGVAAKLILPCESLDSSAVSFIDWCAGPARIFGRYNSIVYELCVLLQ